MTPADVLKELRWRQRLHDAALLAEQENADARVLAEHRAARQLADDRAERYARTLPAPQDLTTELLALFAGPEDSRFQMAVVS